VDPETLEPAQCDGRRLQVFIGDCGQVQHLDMALMHRLQPVAQFRALLGQPHMDRATVMYRAFLGQIAISTIFLTLYDTFEPR